MNLTRKLLLTAALAAPLFFLAPPEAEAQTRRGQSYDRQYAQRNYRPGYSYYPGTRNYSYSPRSGYNRGYAPRYYAPRSYGDYGSRYDRRYYYGNPGYYNRGGSVRVGPLQFSW